MLRIYINEGDRSAILGLEIIAKLATVLEVERPSC
jgi:hypothetical protein